MPQRKRVKLESDAPTAMSISQPEPAEGNEPQAPSGSTAPAKKAEALSWLQRVPVELLSEILIYTGSPKFVLAVSRTCHSLRSTIMAPNSAFIWKEARKLATIIPRQEDSWDTEPPRKVFPMPDPPAGVFGTTDTEAEARYAAFIFDEGVCAACNKATTAMYLSFDLRLRVCKSECRSFDWVKKHPAQVFTQSQGSIGTLSQWIPFFRDDHGVVLLRVKDIITMKKLAADVEPEKVEEVAAFKEKHRQWSTFCAGLTRWKEALGKAKTAMRNVNEHKTRQFAQTYGWDEADLRSATVYGRYLNHKTLLLEEVSEDDLEVLIPKIEEELLALDEKRGRRIQEVSKEANKAQVVAFYSRLRSSKDRPILPSLIAFRQLDAVRVLEAGGGESGESRNVAVTLTKSGKPKKKVTPANAKVLDMFAQGSLVQMLINNALDAWSVRSRDTMGRFLNPPVRPGWHSVRKNVAHPVERVTAWFRCINLKAKDSKGKGNEKGKVGGRLGLCEDRVEGPWREAESWDFAGACRHECIVPEGNGKRGKGLHKDQRQALVDMGCWIRDDEASNAMKAYTKLLGLDEASVETKAAVMKPCAVLCLSCDPPVLLDGRGVVGHSHRHPGEQMKMRIDISDEQVQEYLATYPITYKRAISLCFQPTDEEKKLVEEKIWACRRCYNEERGYKWATTSQSGSSAELLASPKVSDECEEAPPKPRKLVSFHGLRSHMKAKHGYERVRDEDFIQISLVVPSKADAGDNANKASEEFLNALVLGN